jgi:hypothetical protein
MFSTADLLVEDQLVEAAGTIESAKLALQSGLDDPTSSSDAG